MQRDAPDKKTNEPIRSDFRVSSACGTSLPEMCLRLFLAKSSLAILKAAVRVGIIKHLHLLAVDPERPEISPKL